MSSISAQFGTRTLSSLKTGIYYGRLIRIQYGINPALHLLISNSVVLCPVSDYQSVKEWTEGSWIKITVQDQDDFILDLVQISFKHPSPSSDSLRWQNQATSGNRMDLLKQRHHLLLELRKWFDAQNFIETETPLLVRSPSPESQFFLFEVSEEQPSKSSKAHETSYLITSPEFQMKRLLVGGFERIFQICRCFRGQEQGDLHQPEFSMLEWYRAHAELGKVMEDTEALCFHLSKTCNSTRTFPEGPWSRWKVCEVFHEWLGIELSGVESPEKLMDKSIYAGQENCLIDLLSSKYDDMLTYEAVFFRLWNQIVPELGVDGPVWISEWPLPLASLSRPLPDRPGFVDRVECYVNGMELANGFGELTDPLEQRRRFEADLQMRVYLNRAEVPLDQRFLESLEEGMPPSSGMALGIDRLILWLTGAHKLDEVVSFSWSER